MPWQYAAMMPGAARTPSALLLRKEHDESYVRAVSVPATPARHWQQAPHGTALLAPREGRQHSQLT